MRVKVIIVVLAITVTALAAVVVLDPEPDEAVIEYRDDAAAVGETRLMRAERIGRQIWGNVCHGDVAVTVAPLKDSVGMATYWRTDLSENPDPATFYKCVVIVSDERTWPWTKLCQIVVHEMGHLAGREHVANPRSVMYFKGTRHNVPARCRTASAR